jgi:hypothetical protein
VRVAGLLHPSFRPTLYTVPLVAFFDCLENPRPI